MIAHAVPTASPITRTQPRTINSVSRDRSFFRQPFGSAMIGSAVPGTFGGGKSGSSVKVPLDFSYVKLLLRSPGGDRLLSSKKLTLMVEGERSSLVDRNF